MPQKSTQNIFIETIPIEKFKDKQESEKRNTLHQILSTSKYIFKISTTLENLYRYEFDSHSKVIDTCIFKRVRSSDREFYNRNYKKEKGNPTPFNNKIYDVYSLTSNYHDYGYMICIKPQKKYRKNCTYERIYFIYKDRKR